MIPNQPVDWQKELTPFFDLFGTKGNAKADYASLLRAEFYQKLPDDLALRMRKFKKALQDTLFFNRRYGELQIGRSLHPRALGHLIFRFQSRPSLIRAVLQQMRTGISHFSPGGRQAFLIEEKDRCWKKE